MTRYDDYGMPIGGGGAYASSSPPESLSTQALRLARAFAVYRVLPALQKLASRARKSPNWSSLSFRDFFTLVNLLIATWFVVLVWGERWVFDGAVESCRWEGWENWGSDASPHRLVFVADPQLIDPHTYPGRPWPLSTLTIKHTDLYLYRAYTRIQKVLYPDTVIFLGDLFDGGREWSTYTSESPEERWRKYGEQYWLREYDRFGKIFFKQWGIAGVNPRPHQPGRKLITSLPGNHDLGFGKGVQTAVRNRFNAYFGEGNRIDVVGNHTFVSVDTLSLSALDQEGGEARGELWKPTQEFLDRVQDNKRKWVQRELRVIRGDRLNVPFAHAIVESDQLATAALPEFNDTITEFPTILLTHVPLYRSEGTPCGPQREHWPPTPPAKGQQPLQKDERNAIAVRGGYQYQNVLTREITKDIAEKVGDIRYAFSGDDHDYCEVIHRSYPSAGGGIREITVKSISWAMGVRHPGFLMVSMWNPVDDFGAPLSRAPTLQTRLCLLPDQLGIFIQYVTLVSITLIALIGRAILVMTGKASSAAQPPESPLLPTTEYGSSAESEKAETHSRNPPSSASNSSSSSERGNLHIRSSNARTRGGSPNGGYGLPQQQGGYAYEKEYKATTGAKGSSHRKKKGLALLWQEFRWSVLRVAALVLPLYFWLIWRG